MRSPTKSKHSEERPNLSSTGVAGYLFGRNALIGTASFLLVVISGYATWHGMRDFIIGVAAGGRSSGSSIAVSNDVLIVVVVVALTLLMWLALRETFGARRRLRERLITRGRVPERGRLSSLLIADWMGGLSALQRLGFGEGDEASADGRRRLRRVKKGRK